MAHDIFSFFAGGGREGQGGAPCLSCRAFYGVFVCVFVNSSSKERSLKCIVMCSGVRFGGLFVTPKVEGYIQDASLVDKDRKPGWIACPPSLIPFSPWIGLGRRLILHRRYLCSSIAQQEHLPIDRNWVSKPLLQGWEVLPRASASATARVRTLANTRRRCYYIMGTRITEILAPCWCLSWSGRRSCGAGGIRNGKRRAPNLCPVIRVRWGTGKCDGHATERLPWRVLKTSRAARPVTMLAGRMSAGFRITLFYLAHMKEKVKKRDSTRGHAPRRHTACTPRGQISFPATAG